MNAIDLVDKLAENISVIFNRLPEMIEAMRKIAEQNDRMKADLDAAAASASRMNDANAQLHSEIEALRERLHDEFRKNAKLEHLIKSAGEAFGQAINTSTDLQRAVQEIATPMKQIDGRGMEQIG